jgi:hypothetical protein
MKRAAGPILRGVGLLIELACLLAWLNWDYEGRSIGGIAVQHLLLAGVALGFVLWLAGLTLLMSAARRSQSS